MNYKGLFEILWKSTKDTFKGVGWKFFAGSAGALVATFSFGKNFFNTTIFISLVIGSCFFVFLFLIRFILFLIKNSFIYIHKLYRESKYGEAIIILKDAFSKIHFYRNDKKQDDILFMKTMIGLCDSLREIFMKKNMCECSVSIKVPIKGELAGDTSVTNLCRDSIHSKKRDTANYKAIDHTILGNTAFTKVLNKTLNPDTKNNAYINNNISGTPDYDNSSAALYPDRKLPYESEIVVPIIPIERERGQEFKALGFLCVDCEERNKFDEKYDVALIEGVADGIYDVLLTRAK